MLLSHPILLFTTLTTAWTLPPLHPRQENNNSTICTPTFHSSRSPYPAPDTAQTRTIWSNLYCAPNAKNASCPLIIFSTDASVNSTVNITLTSPSPSSLGNSSLALSNTTVFDLIRNATDGGGHEFTFPPSIKGTLTTIDSKTNKSSYFLDAGKYGELRFTPLMKCIDGLISGCNSSSSSERGELATVTACEPVLEDSTAVKVEGFDGQAMGSLEVVETDGTGCAGEGVCAVTTLHPMEGGAGRWGVGWGVLGVCLGVVVMVVL